MKLPTLLACCFTLCACANHDADRALHAMQTCADDLQFNAQPMSCEDAAILYGRLDLPNVDPQMRVDLRFAGARIAYLQRTFTDADRAAFIQHRLVLDAQADR